MQAENFARALVGARRGDHDALAELWTAWNPRVLRFARARGAPDPDDTASQVWLDAARGLHRFDGGPEQFTSWLFTIARRRVVDEHRRRGRRAEIPSAELPDTPGGAPDPAAAGDLDAAIALVRRLPDDQAEAVLLRVVADLDVAEVARIMGRSEGNVRVLTHRGLRRLAGMLGVGFDDEPPGAEPVTQAARPTMSRER
ncbi:MAG: sigma-70 family RNA polymerase sigma factor [Acidimicrobiia bacterium]